MSQLDLSLFGTPHIEIDGQAVHIPRRKATALFAYLAVTGVRHNRDALASLLWPEKSQSSARAELRRVLYFINQAVGKDWLQTNLESIGLNPELGTSSGAELWLDVAEFQKQLKACEKHEHTATETYPDCIPFLEAAVDLYTDHFMAGFSLPDSPEFDEWQFFQAEELRGQLASALTRLSSYYASASRQDFETAIRYARRWLTLDPLHEPAHQQLMELYALSGQKAAALRQYERCYQVLSDELGVSPSEETQSLYQRIRTSTLTPPTGSQPKNNLPLELTSFIGRQDEIVQVQELLQANRLVTVIGHGGIGKTRLAIQVCRAVLDRFQDGVWLVDLAPLSDPEKVPQSAARAVGIPVDTGAQALEALLDYLRPRQMLLVLDNCEHLIEACAQLAEAILIECHQVKILATSREPLGTTGESVYYLPSLPVPNIDELPKFDQLSQFEAIELFESRACAVQSQFAINPHNASDVARLCVQLDGIPLAIELAAAWVRTLPVDQISNRLSENIDFLRGTGRSVLPRHQTLRACLDWSYDLLSLCEQELLEALSVFAGGWTLEAAEAVCTLNCGSQFEVLETLDQLGAKSLVIVEHHPEIETRYRLLEPVRQYASGKLYDSGEMESVRDRHLAYYQFLAEQAKPHLRAHRQIEWLRRLQRELGNIRVALDWAYSEDGPMQRVEAGLRIAADLHFFWQCRCRHMEGFQHLNRLLDLEQQRRGDQQLSQSMRPARAWALTNMAALTAHIGNMIDLQSYNFPAMLDESLNLFNQMGETGKLGLAITKLYLVSFFYDKLDDRFDQLERLFTEFELLGDKLNMAVCLLNQGFFGNDDHPEKYYQKAIILCDEIGDREMIPFLWANMGNAAYWQGEPEKAKACIMEVINSLKDVENDLLASAFMSYELVGHLSWRMGEFCQAEKFYQSAINIAKNQRLYLESEIFHCCIAMSRGDYHKARVQLNNIYLSIHGRDFGRIYTFVVRILADLEWGTGNYAEADNWLTELQEMTVTENIDRMDFNRTSLDIGRAKAAISKMNWYVATKHTISALKEHIQSPLSFRLLYEDKYTAVYLSAIIAFSQGQAVKAAQLLGSTDKSYRLCRLTFPLFRRQLIDQTIEDTRSALDEKTFTTAWEAGKAMDLNEALAYALQVVEEIQTSI
jgi:predicted ATPase/DNA-binding SARP family transcriptional activator